jgi:hypothetical protein
MMKNILIILCILFGAASSKVSAQTSEVGKEKMSVFAPWAGRWQGEGSMLMGPGEPKKSSVDERIESRLDGRLMVIEGIGTATDPSTKTESVVHHAFGVLSYDQNTQQYKFRTYLKDGRETDAWFKLVSENSYQWGFDTPGGKIRYNILIDPVKNTWNETGEFSRDGGSWQKFFQMDLVRIQ